jgi:hypothetical protein
MADILTRQRRVDGILSYLSLFTSFGTLIRCALPSLLMLLGLGTTGCLILDGSSVVSSRRSVFVG